MIVLGITGTRKGASLLQDTALRGVLVGIGKTHDKVELHHGGAIGVDERAHKLSTMEGCLEFDVIVHPPINKKYAANLTGPHTTLPAKDYLIRDQDIVDACDILIVVPKEHQEIVRSGTWATYRRAMKAAKDIIIIRPDGSLEYTNQI